MVMLGILQCVRFVRCCNATDDVATALLDEKVLTPLMINIFIELRDCMHFEGKPFYILLFIFSLIKIENSDNRC